MSKVSHLFSFIELVFIQLTIVVSQRSRYYLIYIKFKYNASVLYDITQLIIYESMHFTDMAGGKQPSFDLAFSLLKLP